MARGGKRTGAGRKPKAKKDKRVAVLVRIEPWLKEALERQRNGNSLSRVVERKLRAAVEAVPQDREIMALSRLVAEIARRVSQESPLQADEKVAMLGAWRRDRFTFEAFKATLYEVLDLFAPPPDSPERKHPYFKTPDELAASLAFWLWNDMDIATFSQEEQPEDTQNRLRGLGAIAVDLQLHNPRSKGGKS